jgi:hypothetical protein
LEEQMRMPAVIALLALACGGETEVAPCELGTELRTRARAAGIDCGRVQLGSSSDSVDACVAEAFRQRRPFVAQYDQQGIDTGNTLGIASDVNGNMSFVRWVWFEFANDAAKPHGSVERCNNPTVDLTRTRDEWNPQPIICESSEPLGSACG